MLQITNLFFLLTIINAQTTSSPSTLVKAPTTKEKRGLYHYDDTFIGPPPPPPPFASIPTIPTYETPPPASRSFLNKLRPNKFTNVFGFDDVSYRNIYNEINGYNYGFPSRPIPPPPPPPQSLGSYGFYNFGYGVYDFETTYVSEDGRVVKQYSVHERHHNDHPEPMNFKPSMSVNTRAIPLQFPRIYISNRNQQAQPRNFNPTPIPSFLNNNHGPVALGSGSLGVIQLPNGEVYLGSGSLGYISHKDHYDTTLHHQNRKQRPHAGDPLNFRHHA